MDDLKVGAAYIRVSTDRQEEYSPDSQLKLIREYAKRDGYIIPEEYVYQDDGISGKSAEKRPAFRLMIATAKQDNPPFDSIFVWKYSRFARNQEEAIMYKNLLRKKRINVVSISEPSSDSPFSSLIERIIEWMDEYYLINLASEVRRGMKEKAQRGEAMGRAPYGYTVRDKAFAVNEEEADIVRYLFSSFASGKGSRALAQEMNDKGIRTKKGNPPDNRWVHYILTNPAYIGKIRWSTEGAANYDRTDYNGENVLTVDGKHPPIIDTETWEAVQKRLKSRNTEIRYQRKNSEPYMLKGLLRCDCCGATLTRISTKSPSLQCYKYSRGQCTVSHSITIAKANKAVIEQLEAICGDAKFTFTAKPKPKSKISHDWNKLIQSEEQRLSRARNAYLDGAFSVDEYKSVKADVESNIQKLQASKEKERTEQPKTPDTEQFSVKVMSVVDVLKSLDISETVKNEALRSVIDKIVYNKKDSSLDFYFSM